jgi:predicted metal-dependent hydrolase
MAKATIVVAGSPAWSDEVAARLGDEYTVANFIERTGYVSRLTDARSALILVDGDDSDWRFWTATPKSSPATRRIPIFVMTDNPDVRHSALLSGADMTLTPAELVAQLPQLVSDYARVPDPALMEQLDCECDEPLPPLGVEGVAKFNAGEYYRQHDLFEEQWVKTSGPVRDLYRAILQVGVAYYQIERGNYRGALKMLLRSVQWLAVLPDVCQGVDVKKLREDSYRVRAELERLGEANFAQFDKALIQPVRMVES